MQGLVQWAIGFGAALALIAGAVAIYVRYRCLLRPIGPAASVVVIGGAFLLGSDQGRDLGLAVLDAPLDQRLWLVVALLYWALATWHNARFPLEKQHSLAMRRGPGQSQLSGARTWWVRWTPRVLGSIVFVFAFVHLWLAYEATGDRDGVLPVAALMLGTAVLYTLFVVFRRQLGESVRCGLSKRRPRLAEELDAAFSARSRKKDGYTTAARPSTWAAFLFFFGVGIAIAAVAWIHPVHLGRHLGSMAIGFFAFGAFLTGFMALWMLTERLNLIVRSKIQLRLPWVVAALLFIALGVSLTRHYHPVRTCEPDNDSCRTGAAIDAVRPTVEEAALIWYAQARETGVVKEDEPVPMIVVATAGGGSRAAYWTAVVLGQLPGALGLDLETFDRHVFAISGVSGGSVGAAFRMAIRPDHADAAGLDDAVRAALRTDFLAPTLASLAFVDIPSWVLPKLGQTTRGVAMEEAFEAAAGERLAEPFLELRAAAAGWQPLLLLNASHQETGRRVITGHVEIDRDPFLDSFDLHELIGIDVPLSTAAHNSARFSYVSPAGRMATYPDDEGRGWIIDGGYFENFGALTALDLTHAALAAIAEATGRDDAAVPVIVQISSDPRLGSPIFGADGEPGGRRDLADIGALAACGGVVGPLPYAPVQDMQEGFLSGNQILAPLRGVLGSRVAHGLVASKALARFACRRRDAGMPVAYGHFAMCEAAAPPLGWVLSASAVRGIESYWQACDNPAALAALRDAFGSTAASLD